MGDVYIYIYIWIHICINSCMKSYVFMNSWFCPLRVSFHTSIWNHIMIFMNSYMNLLYQGSRWSVPVITTFAPGHWPDSFLELHTHARAHAHTQVFCLVPQVSDTDSESLSLWWRLDTQAPAACPAQATRGATLERLVLIPAAGLERFVLYCL